VFAQLHLPPWAGTFVTVLVIAGFPIALALSWFLEFRDGRAVIDPLPPRDSRRRRLSRTYLSVTGALAVAAVAVYTYDKSIGLPEASSPEPAMAAASIQLPPVVENSFAVLPFVNLDGSAETQTFADGLVDDVITQLSRVPGLRVAARGDSYTLAPNSASQNVRDRLRVEMYLEGSVEMSGGIMRVTVQMIDSESGFHILSRRFDRPREEFFDVRDEITDLTVANIRVALPPDVRESSLKVAQDPSLDAYVLYRHGIEASRKPLTIDTIASAVGWFDAALYVDPEYAAAHAGKCAVYVEAFVEVDDAKYIDLAESACAVALTLNPNLDVVHAALGELHASTGDYRSAETDYQEALTINPSNVAALTGLGRTYQRQGRLDEAEASFRKAIDIHPGDAAAYSGLGRFFFQTGRFKEAATIYQYFVALEPNNMRGLSNLASAYMLQGNFAAAAPTFQKALDIEPTQNTYSNLGMMHYYLGNNEAAIDSHANAVKLQPNDHLAHSNLGDALVAAGRTYESLQEYETANQLAAAVLEVNPNAPLTLMDLAWIKTALGQHDEARTLIEKARAIVPTDPYVHYIDGLMRNRVGDTAGAIVALTTAVQNGYSIKLLAGDPNLSALRDDPHFSDILNAAK
jgi:tetratricopeptide (TPR) repeat protein/TolB-like protein